MNHLLTFHAARAYGVDQALVERALRIADPFPLPQEFLTASGFRGDPNTPEHNSYLVARWLITDKLSGVSHTSALDNLCTAANVAWKRPWWLRLGRWVKALLKLR